VLSAIEKLVSEGHGKRCDHVSEGRWNEKEGYWNRWSQDEMSDLWERWEAEGVTITKLLA
jgi:hypothetical protein